MASREPSPSPDPVIALVGSAGLIGREIKERLSSGRLAAGRVRLFETGEREGTLTDYGEDAAVSLAIEEDSFGDADVLILACSALNADRALRNPRKPTAVVIDASGRSREDSAPVVHCDVNPEAIVSHTGMIVAVRPAALLVSAVLHAVRAAVDVLAADAIVFEPASGISQEAMDELYQQTVSLLSFRPVPQEIFGRQIAFNIVALSMAGPLGGIEREHSAAMQACRVLGWSSEKISLRIVLVPVFHCHAVLLRVTTAERTSTAALLQAFAELGSFDAGPAISGDGSAASPVEWAGQEKTRIAEVREAGRNAFWIWAMADDLKAGTALNVVRIAEFLIPAP